MKAADRGQQSSNASSNATGQPRTHSDDPTLPSLLPSVIQTDSDGFTIAEPAHAWEVLGAEV